MADKGDNRSFLIYNNIYHVADPFILSDLQIMCAYIWRTGGLGKSNPLFRAPCSTNLATEDYFRVVKVQLATNEDHKLHAQNIFTMYCLWRE